MVKMYSKFFILFLLAGIVNQTNGQSSVHYFNEINTTWNKFCEAFDSLDGNLMAEIHAEDLIRIAGGAQISDYKTYINNYKKQFEQAKKEGVSNTISLRFFERIHNDSVASERGIYQLVRTEKDGKKQLYYGQFHVLLVKQEGVWKIFMDYDSNENNTINEEQFNKAYGMQEVDAFIQ